MKTNDYSCYHNRDIEMSKLIKTKRVYSKSIIFSKVSSFEVVARMPDYEGPCLIFD